VKREELSETAREFLKLTGAAGWSDAETARELGCTRGAISQIRDGSTEDPTRLLRLLRMTLALRKPEVLKAVYSSEELKALALHDTTAVVPSWAKELLADLEAMDEETRNRTISTLREVLNLAGPKQRGDYRRKAG